MKNIFIERPILAISMAIITLILGGIAIANLAIEQYPNITPPIVEVQAEYTGADAQVVDNSVATPIAQSVMGVSNMLYMQSTSANDGSMSLQVIFEIGSDPDINTILTQSRVTTASSMLPEVVVEEGVVTQKGNDNFLIIFALHGDNSLFNELYLTNYAYLNIQNEILKIDGVDQVTILGAGEYSMRVWLDPQKLDYYGVSVEDVGSAIEAQGALYPAGKFGAEPVAQSPTYSYTVTLPPQISTAEEFSKIILKATSDGEYVRLEDVARVNLGSLSYDVTSRYGDDPTAMVIVYQSVGSNAVEVGAAVRDKIETLSQRFPDGVKCDIVVDSTLSIDAGIKDIFRTLLIALLLVVAIIYLFLQDWRATLIPLIAIPVSLVGAFILFPVLGFSINIVSLLGLVLAIGLVVDDAIVVVEAVQVNIAKGLQPKAAAQEAMRSVTSPIIATTLVLLAVFIPISFSGGVSGLLFLQFAVTLSLSVLLSAINALTLSPALSSILLGESKRSEWRFFAWFNRWYDGFASRYDERVGVAIRHWSRSLVLLGVMGVAVVFLWRALPQGFLPQEDEGYIMVAVELPDNTPLGRTVEVMSHIESIIATLPEVSSIPYSAGYNMLAQIAQSSSGIFFVQLVDYSQRSLSAAQIATKINGMLYVESPEAMSFAFIPPSIPGLGLSSGVTFEVQDLQSRGAEYLYAQTLDIIESLKQSNLTSQVTTQYSQGVTQKLLDVDTEHAMALGVDIEQVYETIGAMLGGDYIGNFNRFGHLYDIYIEADPEFRVDSSSLESYTFTNGDGDSVPLTAFASVRDTVGVNFISQFNLYRSIGLNVTAADRVSSAQLMDYVNKLERDSLPDDIAIAWSGVSYFESREGAITLLVYPLILLIVFLVLAALYNSWSLPLAILLALPIAGVGAVGATLFAHYFNADYQGDIYMQISLVMLIALSAKNAILVVEYAHRNFFEQGMSLLDSARQAAQMRVRPILMTAFAFILGVLPLVFASGVYSTARNIMGVALVGGMSLATILGIYIYPTLFYIVGRIANFEKLREQQKEEKS
ncbi:MAG: efflux RND transporter permease subunit [Rikenellaceae bacterium]